MDEWSEYVLSPEGLQMDGWMDGSIYLSGWDTQAETDRERMREREREREREPSDLNE